MLRRPPRSTRTDTLFPYTTLFRSYNRIASMCINIDDSTARVSQGLENNLAIVIPYPCPSGDNSVRSEEHTSELQSLMRISYAVFCLKKKKNNNMHQNHNTTPAMYTD